MKLLDIIDIISDKHKIKLSIDGAFFKPTNSGESAGIVGMSVKEMEDFKSESY